MQALKAEIFLVEDDPLVAGTVTCALAEYGFPARWFRSGNELLHALADEQPALVIIDLGLPDSDGMDILRHIRDHYACGVLILTGRNLMSDRVLGLETGADDYMVKPFEPRELVARIRSILRRREPAALNHELPQAHRVACFDNWRFDPASLELSGADGSLEVLGAAEARLLLVFLEKAGRVLSREQLAKMPDIHPFDRSIDVRVSRLRKRLADDIRSPRLIKTVYGAGYVFAATVRWEAV